MPVSFAVLGGDSRQRYLAEYLQKEGYAVYACGVPGLPDSDFWQTADVTVLPVPALDAEGRIRGTVLRLQDLPEGACIFGGKLPQGCGTDILQSEAYAAGGASVTAEGAVQLVMEQLPITVEGGTFLVLGAGRIGFRLGQKLTALGGRVTVTARKLTDCARILAAGMRYDETGVYRYGLSQFDAVFSTVPAPVFGAEQIEKTKPECLLVELASAPYGIDADICAALGRQYLLGAALPGKVAPKTAGELIAKEILSQLRKRT